MAESAPSPLPDVRLLRSITLRNILSFGPDTPPLELRALNVLIGPNGSGKSNLLACLSLLPELAGDVSIAFRAGGSTIKDWLRKEQIPKPAVLTIQVRVDNDKSNSLTHHFSFIASDFQLQVQEEFIVPDIPDESNPPSYVYGATFNHSSPFIVIDGDTENGLDLRPDSSVLAQLRSRKAYPAFANLVDTYQGLAFFRDWSFGSISPIRQPQRADSPGNFLREGGENLALVLNQLRRDQAAKTQIVAVLNDLYEGIDDYETFVQAGYVELFLREGKQLMPASRLSDGTLRYLCLLAILLHPTPPPLICLEEPELGLHPDAIVAVGKLIKEASMRTQLIVTTHSMILLDTLSESPEDVVVVSKEKGNTHFNRLDSDKLRPYLEEHSLGNLWNSGDIGGNRW